MEILIRTRKLERILSSEKEIDKRFGESAAKIKSRLSQMKAVANLKDLMALPGGHHALKGDRSGQFACYLKNPHRMVYQPANEPPPLDEDRKIDYSRVTIIEIVEIIDYH